MSFSVLQKLYSGELNSGGFYVISSRPHGDSMASTHEIGCNGKALELQFARFHGNWSQSKRYVNVPL